MKIFALLFLSFAAAQTRGPPNPATTTRERVVETRVRTTTPGGGRPDAISSTSTLPGRGGVDEETRFTGEVTRATVASTSRFSNVDCRGDVIDVGNGVCQDINNNNGCNWDGGDCCGSSGLPNQYTACTDIGDGTCCLDPTYNTRRTTTPFTEIRLSTSERRNDQTSTRPGGIDERTTEPFTRVAPRTDTTTRSGRFDATEPTRQTDPVVTRPQVGSTSRQVSCSGACSNENNKGNGKCNHANNKCGCDWDGGDCCGPAIDDQQYSTCEVNANGDCCLDPTYRYDSGDSTTRRRTTISTTARDSGPGDRTTATRAQVSITTSTLPTGRVDVTDRTRATDVVVTRPQVDSTSRIQSSGCADSCAGNIGNIGNGKCNNVNNNCGCSWDGGDCCGPAQDSNQYSACAVNAAGDCCLDPTYREEDTTTRGRTVPTTTARDDGPGDRTTVPVTRPIGTSSASTTGTGRVDITDATRATDDVVTRPQVDTTSRQQNVDCADTCSGNVNNIGNGKCNNVNNNCGCSWDGGDCCGPAQDDNQYSACSVNGNGDCCLDPSYRDGTTGTTGTTTASTGMGSTSYSPSTIATTGTTGTTTASTSMGSTSYSPSTIATTGTTTTWQQSGTIAPGQKYQEFNADACDSKFSCLGGTCDAAKRKLLVKGMIVSYSFLEKKYDCDCTGCGSAPDAAAAIPGMIRIS